MSLFNLQDLDAGEGNQFSILDAGEGNQFIRDQKNPSNNFDFIKIAAKEIWNIFQFSINEICPASMFLLDFFLEVTQIPVKLY